jgi:predicted NBD/HSP70 family sugar kinase
MRILVIDVGGTNVKVYGDGARQVQKFPSGPTLTPAAMVAGVRAAARDWRYEAVSLGIPAPVLRGKLVEDPINLGGGWKAFDYRAAFKCPVKLVNDAAMQALGSYHGGRMLFLGLGTGLGSAMVSDGRIEPMELAHLPYRKSSFEDYLGTRGLKRMGKKKWRRNVERVVELLSAALLPDEVVIGGGNVKKLKALPPGARAGSNDMAYRGGLRLWDEAGDKAGNKAGDKGGDAVRPARR